MPELPEVESLRRILARSAVGRTVVAANVKETRLRCVVAPDLAAAVAGRTIVSIGRRAKYLMIELSGDHLMMDQRIVAGVGNIYASEILFRARVRPSRRAGRVTRAELERVAIITAQVLREAIGGRGTTFRSYRDSRGQPGRFASKLRVYDREG